MKREGLGLSWRTATILAHGLIDAAGELGPGNRGVVVELGDGMRAIVVISVPDPAKQEPVP